MFHRSAHAQSTNATDVSREDFGWALKALDEGKEIDEAVVRIQRLVHAFPAMGLPLLEALAPHFPQLSRDVVQDLWGAALRNDARHYPDQAQRLMDLCLEQAQMDPTVALEDLILLRGGENQAKAFALCHARAELLSPGSGRALAEQIAMRALRYPIVDFWVFTEAPLVAILEREPAPGFQVAVAGGHLPWLAAWVMCVREVGLEAHDVGIRATFDRLVSAGAELDANLPGGTGSLALALACDGVDQGQHWAELAARLLMDAGAQWQGLDLEPGSDSEHLLLGWPGVRRERLAGLCGGGRADEGRREL